MLWLLPCIAFVLLFLLEYRYAPQLAGASNSYADHFLNLAGLAIQGTAIPASGYLLAKFCTAHFPQWAGSLHIGAAGAFLLNFLLVDFCYYWQHRLFHRLDVLWGMHRCHHAAPVVNIWASARNTLTVNFLFVYLWLNPVLGFLCDRPDAFFAAASVTASLDLWRHARLPARLSPAWLESVLITPRLHHAHHALGGQACNFGANLAIWDKMFRTFRFSSELPQQYGTGRTDNPWRQFIYPW